MSRANSVDVTASHAGPVLPATRGLKLPLADAGPNGSGEPSGTPSAESSIATSSAVVPCVTKRNVLEPGE